MNIARYLILPAELSEFERKYLARVNRVALWFFAAHVPAFAAIAWVNDTKPALAALLTALVWVGPWLATRAFANPRHVSTVHGVTAMAMGALLVNFGRGPMTIEMHFYFFVLLALLSVFGNPAPIVAAAVTVALHHAVLWALLPSAVFNYDAPFWAVLVHASFVVLESIAAVFVARSFFDNVIGLERIVQARTSALDERNAELRRVLDNVGQGFLVADERGAVAAERSAILERWFGPLGENESLATWVSRGDANAGAWLEVAWSSLFDDVLPLEVALDQLPKAMRLGSRHLRLEYRPISDGGTVTKILLVISDVTESVERERAERAQKELLTIVERVVQDRAGFLEFMDEAGRLMRLFTAPDAPRAERMRALHTLKGNFALFGVLGMAEACHELESKLLEDESVLEEAHALELHERFRELLARLGRILDRPQDAVLEIPRADYEVLRRALQRGEVDGAGALRHLERWSGEPVHKRFTRLAEQARALCSRLGKGELRVRADAGDVWLNGERWAPFWAALVHVVRNAVDHGLESVEERERAGKERTPLLSLVARQSEAGVEIQIADDGRGVDWERVREKATRLGLPANTPRELERALYADGFSTKEALSEVSGRGLGMAAVLKECQALGGTMRVESRPGQGTTFFFSIPDAPEALASVA